MIKDLIRLETQSQMTSIWKDMDGLKGIASTVGSWFSSSPVANANGSIYNSPSLSAYSGGVYDSPRLFAFANGAGVFGEAGREAIMPLKRGSDGKLGVQASGQGGGNVTINIEVNEANGTNRQSSEGDERGAWKQMAERVRGVVLEEMAKQKRPGGMLYA